MRGAMRQATVGVALVGAAMMVLVAAGCGNESGSGGGAQGGGAAGGVGGDVAASDSGAGGHDAANADAAAGQDVSAADAGSACSGEAQLALYERRIKPLVDGSQPSSCNQCHLSGVDLSIYVQSDPCQTMACMVKQGMVDLQAPEKSKVLAQIKLAKPQSALITQDVIDAEYQGFLEWITYAGACMEQSCGAIDDACNSPSAAIGATGGSKDVLGSCTEADLGELFRTKVYKWRGRCSPCHLAPGSKSEPTTTFFDTTFKTGDSQEVEFKSALYSMYNVIGIGAVNVAQPDKSLLLINPLAPSAGGLGHAGHVKINSKSEQTYKDFLAWLTAYADCKNKP